ncbi:MAG TPA: hypothetical protein VIU64_08055, partial [Polyangia bacterium]
MTVQIANSNNSSNSNGKSNGVGGALPLAERPRFEERSEGRLEDRLDPPPAPAAPVAKKPSRAKIVLPALLAVAAVGVGTVAWMGRGKEATDDAQVEGHV